MHTLSKVIRFFLPVAALLFALTAKAEMKRHNIFLFDITQSMKWNSVWEPALKTLDATIETQSEIEDSEFTIIPFGTQSYGAFTFKSGEYPKLKNKIRDEFADAMTKAKFTHIAAVLSDGIRRIKPDRMNRIYLLTDGEPDGGEKPEDVADVITKWCASAKNTRLIYVALNHKAVHPTIKKAIEDCPHAFFVEARNNVVPQTEDLLSNEIEANIEELSEAYDIKFSSNGTHSVTVTCDDPIFNIEAENGKIDHGHLHLNIIPRQGESPEQLHALLSERVGAGETYEFSATVQIDDERFTIANPEITVRMNDPILSSLTVFDGEKETVYGGKAEWYDSFLWSKESEKSPVLFDFVPEFNNSTSETSVTFKVVPEKGDKERCKLFFNDKELAEGDGITIAPGMPAVLAVVFDSDAQEGEHNIKLIPRKVTRLNLINGDDAEEFKEITLSADYEITQNPLETILYWVLCLLAGILLAIILVNHLVMPQIKVNTITFTGPGTFYLPKNIKGARKVILTNRNKHQNLLSLLFYGKIIYIIADHFTPQITITPGTKKRIRFSSAVIGSEAWDFIPSAVIGPYEKTTAQHRTTRQKFNIEAQ